MVEGGTAWYGGGRGGGQQEDTKGYGGLEGDHMWVQRGHRGGALGRLLRGGKVMPTITNGLKSTGLKKSISRSASREDSILNIAERCSTGTRPFLLKFEGRRKTNRSDSSGMCEHMV